MNLNWIFPTIQIWILSIWRPQLRSFALWPCQHNMTWACRPTVKRRWYRCKLHGTSTKAHVILAQVQVTWHKYKSLSNTVVTQVQDTFTSTVQVQVHSTGAATSKIRMHLQNTGKHTIWGHSCLDGKWKIDLLQCKNYFNIFHQNYPIYNYNCTTVNNYNCTTKRII